MNEPVRASEPLEVHWGNFAESRVLKQTWLRDGTGRDGRDRISTFLSLWGKGLGINRTDCECYKFAFTVVIESNVGPDKCTKSIRVTFSPQGRKLHNFLFTRGTWLRVLFEGQ